MRTNWVLYLFGIDLAAELLAIYNQWQNVRYITKPLLLLLLLGFIAAQSSPDRSAKKLLIAAAAFSLAGDIILLFDELGNNYFIAGLVSFLLAHICYILLFVHIRRKNNKPIVRGAAIIALLTYAFFFWVLTAGGFSLGDMKIPVYIYCGVIVTMLLSIVFAFDFKRQPAGWRVLAGGILFVISDFLLAYNKFASAFEYAGLAIMATYALAQLLIITGVLKFIGSTHNH